MVNKIIVAFSVLFVLTTHAQAQTPTLKLMSDGDKKQIKSAYPGDWHLLSFSKDSVYGTEVNRAYAEILKGKKPVKIIVAILDSGLDTAQEDLKNVLWVNKKEIAGNGLDDDKNGYKDDVHGWNFLGTADGKTNIDFTSREADREYLRLKKKYTGTDTSTLSETDKTYFNSVKNDSHIYKAENSQQSNLYMCLAIIRIDSLLNAKNNGQVYTYQALESFKNTITDSTTKKSFAMVEFKAMNTKHVATDTVGWVKKMGEDMLASNRRSYANLVKLAGSDFRNFNGTAYGNGRLSFSSAMHGTHVAGIIGADRMNGIGANGIADAVELMGIRVVPASGDEYDEDVANAIKYAVDNGARVISMSFGKLISPNKKIVDAALKYAAAKNVLIVHASGNDGVDTDDQPFYPSAFYDDGGKAPNFITVGGSDAKGGVSNGSNYGKKSVDIFAPGHTIYSTGAGGTYFLMDGTSVAAPVVSGIAALILSYYPKLSAVQLKEVLMNSVTKPTSVPTSLNSRKETMAELSISGGIVNAYEALKLAAKK